MTAEATSGDSRSDGKGGGSPDESDIEVTPLSGSELRKA